MVHLNQKILTISAVLIVCFLFAGLATASSTSKPTTNVSAISAGVKENITAINPSTGKLGNTVDFTLTGTGFSKTDKVYLDNGNIKFPKSIIANGVNLTSKDTITGSFNIPKDANTGVWNVTIKQSGKSTPSKVTFTISK